LIKNNTTDRPRIRTLDSLRGFAALFVVLCHFTDKIVHPKLLLAPFFNILVYGHGAVIFFFVLSGYVLVYQYASNPSYTYGRFLVQRIIRIYIPYLLALLLALLLFLICNCTFSQPGWLGHMWPLLFSFNVFVDHLLLIGNFDTDFLLPPMWSLVHEMRVSFLFPIMLYLLKLSPKKTLAGATVILIIGIITNGLHMNESVGYYNAYTYTIYYLVVFLAGGAVATYQTALVEHYNKLKNAYKVILVLTALLFYNYADVMFTSLFAPSQMHPVIYACGKSVTEDTLITAAACLLIVAAISLAGKKTILEQSFPLFLGKISFSLYLVHTSVGGFIYNSLYGKIPLVLIIAICLVTAFVTAILFNRYVEIPSMRLAKRWLVK
jgi:peptidoglycan/LPS O-acetylase OafA/YrhL